MGNSLKKLKVVIFLALLVNLIGFYFFEPSMLYRLILTGLVFWIIYLAFTHTGYESMILVALYLSFYNLNNLYLGISIPLWVIALIAVSMTSGFFISALTLQLLPATPLILVYAVLIGLSCTEIFLALSLWPTTNSSRSALVVIAFYLLVKLIIFHLQSKLTKRIAFNYLILGSLSLLLILITTSWYDFL